MYQGLGWALGLRAAWDIAPALPEGTDEGLQGSVPRAVMAGVGPMGAPGWGPCSPGPASWQPRSKTISLDTLRLG